MSFKLRWALAVACADVFSFDFSNWVDDLQEKAAASDRFLKWVGILQLGLLALDIWLCRLPARPGLEAAADRSARRPAVPSRWVPWRPRRCWSRCVASRHSGCSPPPSWSS